MISFQELVDSCQAQAISNKLNPTELSIWRKLCRYYSKKFHTSLNLVENLDPEHIILNVYEDMLEPVNHKDIKNLDKLLESIYLIEDPEYLEKKKDAFEQYVEQAEMEEKERQKNKKSKKSLSENEESKDENIPTQGFVDLSYLQNEEENN